MKLGRAIGVSILIEATHNGGFDVKMGCARFAYADKESLIKAISEYLDDPEGHEKMFLKVFGVAEQPTEPLQAEAGRLYGDTLGCV